MLTVAVVPVALAPASTAAPSDQQLSGRALLVLGATGEDVTKTQQQLTKIGISVAVTGTYDGATVKAVKQFQSKFSLKRRGRVGFVLSLMRPQSEWFRSTTERFFTTASVSDSTCSLTTNSVTAFTFPSERSATSFASTDLDEPVRSASVIAPVRAAGGAFRSSRNSSTRRLTGEKSKPFRLMIMRKHEVITFRLAKVNHPPARRPELSQKSGVSCVCAR